MSPLQSTQELGPFQVVIEQGGAESHPPGPPPRLRRSESGSAATLHDQPGAASLFTCALCGARFTHGEKVCGSCPLNRGCEVVRCPNCGYQFPRESLIVRWVTRLLQRK